MPNFPLSSNDQRIAMRENAYLEFNARNQRNLELLNSADPNRNLPTDGDALYSIKRRQMNRRLARRIRDAS